PGGSHHRGRLLPAAVPQSRTLPHPRDTSPRRRRSVRGDGRGGRRGLGGNRSDLARGRRRHRAWPGARAPSRASDRAAQRRRRVGAEAVVARRDASPHGPEQGVTGLRAALLGNWRLKLMSLVFAAGLWAFVVTEERTDALFTVPLDFIDRPPGVEVT